MDKQEQAANAHKTPDTRDQQPVDKSPGEETGKGEQVTNDDLKGKKVDRDISDKKDEPLS